MKINCIKGTTSFKQIKMDEDSYWNLRNRASKKDVESIKKMSIKNIPDAHIAFDPDWGMFGCMLILGTNTKTGKELRLPLGEKPTAQEVTRAINNYNKYV